MSILSRFALSLVKRAHRDDEVTKSFEITAPKEVMDRFERFLAHVQRCAGVGHSTTVGMDIDGDGPDYFYVKQDLPKASDQSEKERRVEIP